MAERQGLPVRFERQGKTIACANVMNVSRLIVVPPGLGCDLLPENWTIQSEKILV